MSKQNYNVIGVMSGTSLDGIDLAHLNFSILDNRWHYKILETQTIPYPALWQNKLKTAVIFSNQELVTLDQAYTVFLANTIKEFIRAYNLEGLDAVCSHGHTILHQPQKGITLQIGNLPKIAEITKQKIVCNFRVQDVKMGGQGAPLVPVGDRHLFSEYEYCLNLGGFSNISFEENGKRTAFDISPVNTVLNFYANQSGLEYDNKGSISRSGKMHTFLFHELNGLEYYQKKYPKSLGIEWVKTIVLPVMEKYPIPTEDKMHTFVEHIAYQTAWALPQKTGTLLLTGGGVFNTFLVERIQAHLPNMRFSIPDPQIIKFKEALIFGFLGVLKLRNEINILSSVTGAKNDHCSGEIFK